MLQYYSYIVRSHPWKLGSVDHEANAEWHFLSLAAIHRHQKSEAGESVINSIDVQWRRIYYPRQSNVHIVVPK